MQNIVTKLILELQQNVADNAGVIDYERFEADMLNELQNLQQCNVSGSLPLPTKEEILAEAESIYKECNTSNEAEAVRQAGTAKLMFIAGAWFSRGFKRQ